MPVPYLTDEALRKIANDFQRDYNLPKHLPVPIGRIAEFGFEIDIIPIPGLQSAFDIVAFISKDLSEIRVDEYVYKNQEARFRFTIAHELSHVLLHRDIFDGANFKTTDQWKEFMGTGISEADYSRMEFQANALAGLILVPESRLGVEFRKAIDEAKKAGLDPFEDVESTTHYVASYLKREDLFNVGLQTMKIRIEKDSLFALL